MKNMGLNELREAYLKFFETKDHLRMPSFSLIPNNDKSLLLINAGMAPLKPYFTGIQVPPRKRVTTCQKCIRTGDIENVGITSRHGTFFEMLGNFSFGDYFKKEVIPWAWEFITEVLQIPKDKLYVTIHISDDEAYDIWTKSTDIDPTRIFRLDEDNFWEVGQGPCGPCSEIHFDRGIGKISTVEEFVKAGDEDRVVEFWNLVFTQYDKDEQGNYNKLKNPNIDTGMGLERIATIMQGTNSIFEVDTIKSILNEVCRISDKTYGKNHKEDISLRIITDHIRSVTFLISDGVLPSNEGRGYVLRRILRRAARHGRLLGIKETFLYNLCQSVIDNSRGAYPELKSKESYIKKVIKLEEERFNATLDSGMEILLQYMDEMKEENSKVLSGANSFKLYDTYGFPMELIKEILSESGLTVDEEEFSKLMKNQKEMARAARAETNYMGIDNSILNNIPKDINTKFVGYDKLEVESNVSMLISEEEFVVSLNSGESGIIITEETPFYAEMGGQVGDTGKITADGLDIDVLDCKKTIGGKFIHFVKVLKGTVNTGDKVILKVDKENRNSICKNHTATHMLQAALRDVLGDHVHQSGSYVDNSRLRFDFTHFTAMTEDEIHKVELIVNKNIMDVYEVNTKVMSLDEAKKSGATALFDEKYKDEVRVVSVGDFSRELCGGTHVRNSGQIGLFKIISESGVAAGIRRIEACTGIGALEYMDEKSNLLKESSLLLKCSEKDIITKIKNEANELKEKEKEINELKSKIAGSAEEELLSNVKNIDGINLITGILKDIDAEALRNLADKLKTKVDNAVVVLGSVYENKVQLLAMASKSVLGKGIHCGKIIKEVASITGGGGGGRPDMAQAGGKLPEKLSEAIENTENIVKSLLK